jgi:hypothetical protein
MNVPFPPPLLWPVVVVIVVGAVFWRRWQKRAFLAAPAEDWPKHAPKGWKHSRIYPWLFVIAGVIGAYSLWRFSAPCVYGQVVDATTDKPVAGALVMRTISRKGPPSLAESGSIIAESFSFWTTHTGKTGHFFLPGWVSLFPFGISGTSGMTWVVYHPGLMPGRGCLSEGFTGPGGCGGESGFSSADPWVLANAERHFGMIHLELRIYPPTLEGVVFRSYYAPTGEFIRVDTPADADPWGEYFRRLNVLTQSRYLTIEEFVKEAVAYVERDSLTEGMLDPFSELASRMGTRRERALLVRHIVDYCNSHPNSSTCRHVGPRYVLEVIGRGKVHR